MSKENLRISVEKTPTNRHTSLIFIEDNPLSNKDALGHTLEVLGNIVYETSKYPIKKDDFGRTYVQNDTQDRELPFDYSEDSRVLLTDLDRDGNALFFQYELKYDCYGKNVAICDRLGKELRDYPVIIQQIAQKHSYNNNLLLYLPFDYDFGIDSAVTDHNDLPVIVKFDESMRFYNEYSANEEAVAQRFSRGGGILCSNNNIISPLSNYIIVNNHIQLPQEYQDNTDGSIYISFWIFVPNDFHDFFYNYEPDSLNINKYATLLDLQVEKKSILKLTVEKTVGSHLPGQATFKLFLKNADVINFDSYLF